jgi:hypothetical protein
VPALRLRERSPHGRQGEAAQLDVEGADGKVTWIAAKIQDLQALEDAFADLRGLAIVQRRQAGAGTGIEEVRSRTVLDLQARADIANGVVVLQLDHEHARSTYVSLSVDQIEELERLLMSAKSELAAHRRPN